MKGIQIFTDEKYEKFEREIFASAKIPSAAKLHISDTASNFGFKGFGVAITGSSCYLLNQMEEKERRDLLRNVYSKDKLALSVGRLSIGASDYSAELYSYDDVEGDVELKHFSIERDREYVIPMIKEILAVNPDLYIFASPWSPPGWMKTGGSLCGGYMRKKYTACYAKYIVKFIKEYAKEGIKISAITPQNEPETQQAGNMPACIWHPEIESKFIFELRKELDENNLDVDIWMHDHNFNGTDKIVWLYDNIPEIKNACKGVAYHYYSGTIEQTDKLTEKHPYAEKHFTEGGPRLYDNYGVDWCKWSLMISKAINHGYKSFTGWNLMLDDMGSPDIGPFFCGGLITKNSITGELSYSGQFKAMSHISPYINENSRFYPITTDKEFGNTLFVYPNIRRPIEGFMIDNNDGKYIAVIVNTNETKERAQLILNDEYWFLELTANSVSTIIIER